MNQGSICPLQGSQLRPAFDSSKPRGYRPDPKDARVEMVNGVSSPRMTIGASRLGTFRRCAKPHPFQATPEIQTLQQSLDAPDAAICFKQVMRIRDSGSNDLRIGQERLRNCL